MSGRDESDLDVDAALDLLSHPHRRHALYYLSRKTDGVARFEGLVDFLTDRLDRSDRERVAISLCHHHLPRLDVHGVIEYDRTTDTVRYRGHPLIERFLDLTVEHDLE